MNIPKVKPGIIAVSRDCFPIELSQMRRSNIVKAFGEGLYECPITVENEIDAQRAIDDVKAHAVNALVVFLGNFGPETPETLLVKKFDGPVMCIAAAEGDGDMINGRGVFAGLSMNTTREEMSLAVLEGVAFSIKQNIEIIKSLGVKITKSKICGGGTKNRRWIELMASILGVDIEIPVFEHGGVLGACILAAKGDGNDVSGAFCGLNETIRPQKEVTEFYERKYLKYLKLYPMIKML